MQLKQIVASLHGARKVSKYVKISLCHIRTISFRRHSCMKFKISVILVHLETVNEIVYHPLDVVRENSTRLTCDAE